MNAEEMIAPSPTWYVMFSGDAKRNHLIDWISPIDFLHVNTFCYDVRAERWIVYDVNRGGVAVKALTSSEMDWWIAAMRSVGARILKVAWQPAKRWPLQIGMWCVVAVRYAIGCKSLAIRPIGLYRDLLKQGAEHFP